MQVDVLNIKGEKTGRTVSLPDDIFAIEPNDHCIYLAVKHYLATARQGSHKTKTRGEVKGSSRKLHRQKGTGGSRKGNIRNPLYKGGGAINGPIPHKYGFKLNRKVKDLAKMSALSYKAANDQILVVEDLGLEAPKTKPFAAMLNSLPMAGTKSLYVLSEFNMPVYYSSRNLPGNKTVVLSDMNTYDLVNAKRVIFTESAALMFQEGWEEVEASQEAEAETN